MMVGSRPRLPTMYYNDSKNMKIQNEIVLFGNSTIKTGMPFNFFKNGGFFDSIFYTVSRHDCCWCECRRERYNCGKCNDCDNCDGDSENSQNKLKKCVINKGTNTTYKITFLRKEEN